MRQFKKFKIINKDDKAVINIYKALLIGVNKYKDKTFRILNNVANDILGIARILGNSSVDYGQRNLLGAEATKDNIIESLEVFFECKNEDTLFLYWAGHGSSDGNGYFIAYDTENDNKIDTAVEMSYVKELIEKTNAKAVVVMFDCCYSGTVARDASDFRATMERSLHVIGKGKVIIAACDDYQKAYELENESHGRFTYHVLQGLKGNAADTLGNVNVFNLYTYVSGEMSKYPDLQTPVFNCTVTSPVILNSIETRAYEENNNRIQNKTAYNENITKDIIISDSGKWCLLNTNVIKYNKIIESDDLIEVSIINPLQEQISVIRSLKARNPWSSDTINFTFKDICESVKVENVEINHTDDENYTVKLRRLQKDLNFLTEMSIGIGGIGQTVSPKEIAELRARRILLGEEKNSEFSRSEWNMLNTFISKNGSSQLIIDKPLLKESIKNFKDKSIEEWKLIRLYMVYYLIASNTVEYIENLKLFIDDDSISKVEFIGIRHKINSSAEADKIVVNDKTVF